MSKEAEDDYDFFAPKYYYQEQRITQTVYHYYLYGIIEEPRHYTGMIHHIFYATEGDEFHIHLNTQGGSLDTGVAILNAMLATKAHVVVHLESQAFSLGTMIFLAGKEWVVHNHTMLMFHNYSGETWGKGNEIVAHVAASEKWHREITKSLYIPFLSEEEYEKVLEGADMWFHPPEIRKRLNKAVKFWAKDKKANDKA